jgi:hypothetical protein
VKESGAFVMPGQLQLLRWLCVASEYIAPVEKQSIAALQISGRAIPQTLFAILPLIEKSITAQQGSIHKTTETEDHLNDRDWFPHTLIRLLPAITTAPASMPGATGKWVPMAEPVQFASYLLRSAAIYRPAVFPKRPVHTSAVYLHTIADVYVFPDCPLLMDDDECRGREYLHKIFSSNSLYRLNVSARPDLHLQKD